MRHGWLVVYAVSVLSVNWLWGVNPWLTSVIVGGLFMVRDVAQVRSGRLVLVAMAAGLVASYLLASPGVALASAVAFGVSEGVDYLCVAKMSGRSLVARVIITQPISVLLDTVIFMVGLSLSINLPWSWQMFGVQVLSKTLALLALIVWRPR